MLDTVRRNPSTSLLAIVAAVGGSRSSVHRVLEREGLQPYYLQRVPSLLSSDHPTSVFFVHRGISNNVDKKRISHHKFHLLMRRITREMACSITTMRNYGLMRIPMA
ncbi:hypothetical protein TNCV_711181 [Trichonephila clavipes]|nr:hypothetical protein TNCV_711181 [Trichonephila clavipes]